MVEVAEVGEQGLLAGEFDADAEVVVLVLELVEFVPVGDGEGGEVAFQQFEDGSGVAQEGSEDQYLAVGEPSALLLAQAPLQMLHGVAHNHCSELLDLLLLLVLDEDVVEVALHQCLAHSQRALISPSAQAAEVV